jgi:hypothetical protein
MEELRDFLVEGKSVTWAIKFLEHFCRPISVLLYLTGMPQRMIYHRAESGAGVFTFLYDSGTIANLVFTFGGSGAGGAERMSVIGNGEYRTIVVENCRIYCFQGPGKEGGGAYGNTPSYYTGPTSATPAL